jgi:ATP-dependent DNA helicase RecG
MDMHQVGVDVPEASVMVVEGAERFGLAALHQLRGRVGRGARPSRCFLISQEDSARLAILETSHSGFSIAEADLVHRSAPRHLQ